MTAGGWLAATRLRQGVYRLCGAAFLPPEDDRVALLASSEGALEALEPDAFPFAAALRRFLGAVRDAPPTDVLEGEYIRLFEAGVDGALCPPTESFHTTAARHGGPAEVDAVLESTYADIGIVHRSGTVVTPDHISVELEAMAFLCAEEAGAREADDLAAVADSLRRQHRFLREHLARWAPVFLADVRRTSRLEVYRDLAEATEAFVRHDHVLVGALVRAARQEVGA